MHRLSDHAPPEECIPRYASFESVIGREMVLASVFSRDGRYGEYLALELRDPETGEILTVATGSITVARQIERYLASNQLPCLVTPEREGRRYVLR